MAKTESKRSFNVPWKDYIGQTVIVSVEEDGPLAQCEVEELSKNQLVVKLLIERDWFKESRWYHTEQVQLVDEVGDLETTEDALKLIIDQIPTNPEINL